MVIVIRTLLRLVLQAQPEANQEGESESIHSWHQLVVQGCLLPSLKRVDREVRHDLGTLGNPEEPQPYRGGTKSGRLSEKTHPRDARGYQRRRARKKVPWPAEGPSRK